eukprot:CAMPEP_0174704610 /NCGR_PEP_ID=MMETSP1094-20130205/8141_1 /TAXON_ID=156173 /ORGANISM="Chrysochromulina brevifilum, Strain UTEX LB 985" /LENGTH=153 /DNA_ID=CAMNT_0015902689 /DNA_START=280 /DNA_END=741 /DNA_ORIENTATION=+
MRWAALPLPTQMDERAIATIRAATLVDFFESAVSGKWEGLLEAYTGALRREPDPSRRHAAASGEWSLGRTMRNHKGLSWDGPNGTALSRLPAQYRLRQVMLSQQEQRWLASMPLPHAHIEDDLQGPPPREDAWLYRSWRKRQAAKKGHTDERA